MATPANRVPVRIARGSKANLDTAIAAGDLKEGEICYATDENGVYVVEGGALTQAGADLAFTSVGALSDVDITTTPPTDGQFLVWNNADGEFQPGDVALALDDLSDVTYTTGSLEPTALDQIVFSSTDVPGTETWKVFANASYGMALAAYDSSNDGSYVYAHPAKGIELKAEVGVVNLTGDSTVTTNTPEIRLNTGQPTATTPTGNYFGLKLPAGYSTDQTYTVPAADGASGQALVTDGSGGLSWSGVSGEIEWTLTANGSTDYIFAGAGFAGTETDPVVYVVRGQTYKFTYAMGAHPFQIQSTSGIGGTAYNDGITNNAVSNGTLTWEVRMDAPSTLYYQCTSHADMNGTIYVLDEGSAVQSIDDLSDVDTTTVAPTDGQVLAWDNAAGKWEPATIAGGGASVTTSDTAPASPSDGDLWYRSTDGRTYVYYDDGNTSQWVDANPNLPVGSDTFERSGTTVSLTNAGDSLDIGPLFVDGGAPADSVNVDSSGRLGIGTAAPSFLLHLDGGNMHRTRSAEGTSGTPQEDALVTYGNASTGYGGVYALNSYATDTSTQLAFKITDGSSNTSEALRIDSSGNVGVNVSSPTEKIDVEGNIRARDASNVRGAYLSNDGAVEIFKDTSNGYIDFKTSIAEDYDCRIQQESNGLRFDTGGNAATAERVRINANGTTTFNGTVETNERTITAGAFDLATGNHWTCGAITVPAPTNATAGTSGLIRITAGPVTWNTVFKFPGGTAPTIASFPAVIPFYVQDSSNILMGNVAEGIA